MPKNCTKILLFFLLRTFIAFSLNLEPIGSEREVMLKLKQQWGSAPFIQAWNPAIPPCNWPGIQCTRNSITGISIRYKHITDRIPALICDLKNLATLDLSGNSIPGGFPIDLYNCFNLQILDLSQNSFVGPLPSDVHKLSSLQYLDISFNSFTSAIPSAIGHLTNLTNLNLAYNSFNGTIPPAIGKLQKLETLHVEANRFSGSVPVTIGKLPALKHIFMFFNSLSEVLPPDLGLHSKLETLDISFNLFSGDLPKNLCAQGALATLNASVNNFNGEIPESLAKCNSLTTLLLSSNGFTGMIPFGLWTLPNISTLSLSSNSISGQLPMQLSARLNVLDIINNKFSGPIPSSAPNWTNLVEFKVSTNQFWGSIPLELTALSKLETLLLDRNQFSGELPSQIISWKSLATLHIFQNNLSGPIPAALGFLPSLESLDLSNNELSGPIPEAFGFLPRLYYLGLSNNELSGQIPPELGRLKDCSLDLSSNRLDGKIPSTLYSLVDRSDFSDNSNLCSDIQTSDLPRCSSLHRSFRSGYLPMILLPGLAVLLVILYLILSRVTVKHDIKQPAWTMTPFHSLNFTEEKILCNLIEDNVIGSGGSGKIYCITISDSDSTVAVKRIWNDRKFTEALEKQFAAEVEILGTIRHANIVKLLCCISSENSKLLVYEYMENQSLDKWLHRERRGYESSSIHSVSLTSNSDHSTALDWPTRLRIAIGAAKGLCYMHHDCNPPIIHRDVKSSNILLDSEFNAKIADFGLAKMSPSTVGEPHTASAVAGSFGYIAPEYWGTRRLNEKIDIYSFGVVLLELATGKEACKGNEHLNLADWSWQHYCEGFPIEDALDNRIKDQCFLLEIMSIFKLGLMCTNKVPSSRPSMKQVLQLLILCSHHHASDRRTQDPEEPRA